MYCIATMWHGRFHTFRASLLCSTGARCHRILLSLKLLYTHKISYGYVVIIIWYSILLYCVVYKFYWQGHLALWRDYCRQYKIHIMKVLAEYYSYDRLCLSPTRSETHELPLVLF